MEENKTPPGADQGWKEKLTDKASELKEQADVVLDKVEDKAEATWKEVSEKAEEWKGVAEEKLEDLKKGAESIWNKIVDKFDGDNEPQGPTAKK